MASDAAERRAAELVALLRLSDPLSGERIYVVNVADAMEPAIATALDAHAAEATAALRAEVEALNAAVGVLNRRYESDKATLAKQSVFRGLLVDAIGVLKHTHMTPLRLKWIDKARAALGKEVG